MKRVVCLFLLLSTLISGCASAGGQSASPLQGESRVSPLAPVGMDAQDCTDGAYDSADLNQLGFDLHQILADDATGENIIFSPYGVAAVFSMAYAGARGATADEMATTLHFLPQAEQHAQFRALTCRLARLSLSGAPAASSTDATELFQLHSANGLFPQADVEGIDFRLAEDFRATLANAYAAQTHPLDYVHGPSGAVDWINAWVNEHTAGRIPDLLTYGEVTPRTRLVLANAVFFKAAWQHPFDPARTGPGSFTLADETQVTVPFMRGSARAPYLRGDDFQAVLLPYAGDAVDLLVVMPDLGRFDAVARRQDLGATLVFDPDTAALRADELVKDVTVAMPKFTLENDIDLVDVLREAGLELPFAEADFSGITGSDNDLYISAALQKAMIVVDENGTEAAAATAAVLSIRSLQRVDLTLDRPFLFAVRDRETQAILFLGRVMNPVN